MVMRRDRVNIVLDILEETYPEAECALDHRNVFELVVAVALSAQTTDVSVNKVTPMLFEKYPDGLPLEILELISKILQTAFMTRYQILETSILNIG